MQKEAYNLCILFGSIVIDKNESEICSEKTDFWAEVSGGSVIHQNEAEIRFFLRIPVTRAAFGGVN